STGDDDFAFAERDRLGGEGDRFEPGTANLVDGHGGDAGIAATLECGLASRILAKAGLGHVAEDGFVNLFELDVRTAGGFGNHFAAELRGGEALQSTLELAYWGSDCREDYRSFHRAASNA